jgi:hypothetical protein
VVRRVLGVLLGLAGAGVVAGAIGGRAGLDVGSAGAGAMVWPATCVLGGLLIMLGGWWAARHGHEWPEMSARYERRPAVVRQPSAAVNGNAGGTREEDRDEDEERQRVAADNRAAWDALDRGDDPTDRDTAPTDRDAVSTDADPVDRGADPVGR